MLTMHDIIKSWYVALKKKQHMVLKLFRQPWNGHFTRSRKKMFLFKPWLSDMAVKGQALCAPVMNHVPFTVAPSYLPPPSTPAAVCLDTLTPPLCSKMLTSRFFRQTQHISRCWLGPLEGFVDPSNPATQITFTALLTDVRAIVAELWAEVTDDGRGGAHQNP